MTMFQGETNMSFFYVQSLYGENPTIKDYTNFPRWGDYNKGFAVLGQLEQHFTKQGPSQEVYEIDK